jgi:hypothetical protein
MNNSLMRTPRDKDQAARRSDCAGGCFERLVRLIKLAIALLHDLQDGVGRRGIRLNKDLCCEHRPIAVF